MLKSLSNKVTDLHHGERFDVVATALFTELSRKKIKTIIDGGGAYINKKRITVAKHAVKIGDRLEVFWEQKSPSVLSSHGLAEDTLIYENKDFFVINKPAGIASQATLTSSKDTIIHSLCSFNPDIFNIENMFLVHRLDKDTSGLMLIAKNQQTQKKFEILFSEKQVKKTYEALCFYAPAKISGKISYPIARNRSQNNCYFAVTNNNPNTRDAKSAETDYVVSKVFRHGEACLIKCKPKTGRTHQIRVHLSAIGCPVLGDKTYSQNIHGHRYGQLALRHMLHATHLEFSLDGVSFEFTAPLPEDFTRVLHILSA